MSPETSAHTYRAAGKLAGSQAPCETCGSLLAYLPTLWQLLGPYNWLSSLYGCSLVAVWWVCRRWSPIPSGHGDTHVQRERYGSLWIALATTLLFVIIGAASGFVLTPFGLTSRRCALRPQLSSVFPRNRWQRCDLISDRRCNFG